MKNRAVLGFFFVCLFVLGFRKVETVNTNLPAAVGKSAFNTKLWTENSLTVRPPTKQTPGDTNLELLTPNVLNSPFHM